MGDMACIRILLEICSLLTLAWANPRLLFANRRDIRIIDAVLATNGTVVDRDQSQVVINNLEDAAAVDYLFSRCTIFWTDVSNEMIKYTYCNGTQQVTDIVTTGLIAPDGLACDWIGMKIYWTDSETNRVEVSELDGSSRKVLFWQDLDQPRAIALDPENGYLYWTDWGEIPKIERAGMDGTSRTTIIDDQIYWPNGLTIDYSASKLYWADAKQSYIHSCNMDGTNRRVVIQGMLPHPFALTLFDDLIYWTDWETKSIHTCDKITGGEKRVIHDDLYSPMDIHVYDERRQQQTRPSPCGSNNGGCSHLCLMAPQPPHFACTCPTGVKLKEDGLTCNDGAEEILLLARRRDIRRISLDTEDYTDVVLPLPDIMHAIAIDYDPVDGYIYWSDDEVKAIRRAKPDGTDSDYIITSDIEHPDGIAVDWIARNIYWTATGTDRIEVSRLNGTSRKILISDDLDEPRAIAVDPAAGYMYWTDWGVHPKIERAALDGTMRSVLINTSLMWPNGLALDFELRKIYWGDGKEDRIEMADMDGRNRVVLVSDGIPHIFGFTLLGNYVYWTDWQKRRVERVNKITGLERMVIREQLPDLMGLKAVNVNMIIGDNPCSVNNGGCSHLCLYRPQGHVCSCPMRHELLADQRSCIVPEAFLLFSLENGIWRISLETSHNNKSLPLEVKQAASLDFNDGMVYWSDTKLKTISKAYMNGTGVENVIEFGLEFPEGIAVDWVAHNIYFSDTGTNRIEVARLDGTARRVIIWQDIVDPRSIAIDPQEGYMYFSDWGSDTFIERAYMDGTHRKKIIDKPGRANGLTIDYGEKRLYWTAIDTYSIESSNLIGTSKRQLIANELENPFSLTQYGDYLYFADWKTNSIDRLNKTSGANRTRIQRDVEFVMDILVMHSSRQEGWNLCAVNNGGCEHLCLSHPNISTDEANYVCGCPSHYTLNLDGKTCTAPEKYILFSQRLNVNRMTPDMDEGPDITLPIHTIRNIKAIEFDPVDKQLYWIDNKSKTVKRVNETGIGPTAFIRNPSPRNFTPYDFAIEPYSRLLFWTCSQTNVINVTRLDGRPVGVVISDETNERPRALTLIPEKGLMFWTNLVRNQPKIERASLDGTEHTVLFSTGLGDLGALAADHQSNRLFWVDTFLERIEAADISGANRITLVEQSIGNPVGLAVFGEHLYWADRVMKIIARADKLTGDGLTKVIDEVPLLSDIITVDRDLQENHPCIVNNGGCTHLCIPLDNGRLKRCSCPIDLVLQDDDVSCGEPPTCSPLEFTCETGTIGCVPMTWLCDEADDCDDGSDERLCPYCSGEDEFKCSNGQCIMRSQRCDNQTDCDDDESHCYGNCLTDQYRCANQQCLDISKARCDGTAHCRDLSDEQGCEDQTPNPYKDKGLPSAVIGALVTGAFVVFMVVGFFLIYRRCRHNSQNAEGQYDAASNQNYSTVLMLNQLSTGRTHLKSTNLHKAGPKSSSSSNGLYERNHPTGASSCSSEMMSSSGNSGYPKETLNPPPSPVTTRSNCTSELYYAPQSPSTSRSYRHYKMRNIPPHPTPCSSDVCDDSETYAATCPPQVVHAKVAHGHHPLHHHHHHHQKHTRRKKGKYYTNVSNLDLNYDREPYPPPPTPRSQLSDNYESCPPSPSTERSFYNPFPPPPSPATDST